MRVMTGRHDVYGFPEATLDEVAPLLRRLLGVPLQERDSSYYAGTYYLYKQSFGRELRLYRNRDPVNGSLVREQYRDYPVILEVSGLDNMDEIRRAVLAAPGEPVLLASRAMPADPG